MRAATGRSVPQRWHTFPPSPIHLPHSETPMKYDDAEYQFLAFTNPETPMEWGGRVMALYFAWALSRRLCSEDMAEAATALQGGASPVELLFDYCDGSLLDQFFSEEGNAFTAAYYNRDYYADYETVFDGEYADTGHPSDDALSIADTPANLARMSALLDRRFAQWKAGLLVTTADEVFAVAEQTLSRLLAARGMAPATPRDWDESPELRGAERLRFWGGEFAGGREWVFYQVVSTAEGTGLHINLSSRIDDLAKEAWTIDLRPHLTPRIAKPGDRLPITALIRMAAWWPYKVIRSKEGPPAAVVASRTELELLPGQLEHALRQRGFPLLDQARSAAGLGRLQQFGNPAKAVLSNAPTSLVPLLSAEHAGRPDLMALCDAWEAAGRTLNVAPHIHGAMQRFAEIIRQRNVR